MNFDIETFLHKHDLEYKETSNNYILKECPLCGNSKFKFGILKSQEKKYVSHCFVCDGGMNIYKLIMLLEDVNFPKAKDIFDNKEKKILQLHKIEKKNLINKFKKHSKPSVFSGEIQNSNFRKLHEHIPYTKKRAINLDMIEKFDLHFCDEGAWKNRLMIPIKHKGVIAGWQGRDVTGRDEIKIKSTKGFQKKNFILNYDYIFDKKIGVLCEGPFDVMHAQMASSKIGAFGILGKDISDEQINLLLETKLKTILIGLDPDHPKNIFKAAYKLNDFFNIKILPIPKEKDLGDMSPSEIKCSIQNAKKIPTKIERLMKEQYE